MEPLALCRTICPRYCLMIFFHYVFIWGTSSSSKSQIWILISPSPVYASIWMFPFSIFHDPVSHYLIRLSPGWSGTHRPLYALASYFCLLVPDSSSWVVSCVIYTRITLWIHCKPVLHIGVPTLLRFCTLIILMCVMSSHMYRIYIQLLPWTLCASADGMGTARTDCARSYPWYATRQSFV